MAKQDPRPPSWHERLSDGCTGVPDYAWIDSWILNACLAHDADMYWGPGDEDGFQYKLECDQAYRANTAKGGWWGQRIAPGRFWGVRKFTYNAPPRKGLHGYQDRYDNLWDAWRHGQRRIEVMNWLGPGRGGDAHGEAKGSKNFLQLLPEQMPEVAAAREVA